MLASLNGVTKYFGDKLILSGVELTIEDNDRIGLIGANGIGKSTLLNILCQKLLPDEGSVNITNGVTIGFLEQNSGLLWDSTIYAEMRNVFKTLLHTEEKLRHMEREMAEDVHKEGYAKLCEEYSRLSSWFEARDGYHIDVKIKTVLNGMGFEEKAYDMPISALSGGEKTRLAIARLLLEEPGLLILDEPTNHLDFRTLLWLEDYLKEYKGGLLVVSHDRYFLDKMVQKTWEIENRKVVSYPGNYTKYKALRAERYKRMQKEYEAQQQKINAMREYAEKNIVRATTSNMAKSRLHQLAHIEVLEKPVDRTPTPHFRFAYEKKPVKDLLAVKNLTLTAGQGEDRVVLSRNISFELKRGEKAALIGPNGVGKSTLLKTLLGDLSAEGEIIWGDRVEIGYYDQENLTLNPENTALQEIWDRFPRLAQYEARGLLGQVLITGDKAFQKIGLLSGGERARVAMAVLMGQHANMLVLDEPTNHLDLQSKEELEKALSAFEGTLLFVSHDRYFLNRIPQKIIELRKDGLSVYPGGFDDYLSALREKENAALPEPSLSKPAAEKAGYRSRQERAEQTKRRAQIRRLEEMIETSEAEIRRLEEEIFLPETGSDYQKLTALCARLEEEKALHDSYFSEWAGLSEGFSSIDRE